MVELKQAALAQALQEAVDARGFPGMADVDSSLLLFARKIAPQARFALSGECGDEVFGGYPWFRDAHSLNGESFPWSGSLELRAGVLKRRVREKLNIHKYVREALSEAVGRVEHLPHESADGRCLRTMQHLCFEFFMANLQERALTMCEHSHVAVLTPFGRRAADAVCLQRALGDEIPRRAGKGAFARGRGRAFAREPALSPEEPLSQDLRSRIRPHRLRHGAGHAGGKAKPRFCSWRTRGRWRSWPPRTSPPRRRRGSAN